jgi:SdpC family antimicrobial peptide
MKSRYSSGKAVYKVFLMLMIIAAGFTNLYAQSGDKVRIRLSQPPPNQMGVGDMWNLELNNTTDKEINIYLTGTATEEKDGLIIEGKSKVFTLKPGRSNYKYNDFSSAEVKYNNGKYKEIILRTGNAPEGSYTICVTAFDESGTEVGRENCIMQSVQQLGGITLITPFDGEEVAPEQPIIFTWTPLQGAKEYSLQIVEVKGDQSPEVAMKQNRAILELNDIRTTTHQVAPSQVKVIMMGMKYAWQVSSGDVKSEVAVFKVLNIGSYESVNDGIMLFNGVFWGEGQAAEELPELKEINIINLIDDEEQVCAVKYFQNVITEKVESENPEYLKRLSETIRNGSHLEIEQIISEGGKLVLQKMNYSGNSDSVYINKLKDELSENKIVGIKKFVKMANEISIQKDNYPGLSFFLAVAIVAAAVIVLAVAVAVDFAVAFGENPAYIRSHDLLREKYINSIAETFSDRKNEKKY